MTLKLIHWPASAFWLVSITHWLVCNHWLVLVVLHATHTFLPLLSSGLQNRQIPKNHKSVEQWRTLQLFQAHAKCAPKYKRFWIIVLGKKITAVKLASPRWGTLTFRCVSGMRLNVLIHVPTSQKHSIQGCSSMSSCSVREDVLCFRSSDYGLCPGMLHVERTWLGAKTAGKGPSDNIDKAKKLL